MAVRPRTLPAAIAPVVLATGMAASRGAMRILPAAAALVGALLIQMATNLANDYFDHAKGSDTENRMGPTRVVQAGLLPPDSVLRAAVAVLGFATVVGAYLVWVGGAPILFVGLVSLVCAVAYTGGPFPLAYHGLGDLFVFLFFGLVAVGGSYWVQALALPSDVVLAGVGVGALATAILVVNNLRDIETDMLAGKHTLAVRIGVGGTRVEYIGLVVVGAAVPLVGVMAFGWSPWTLLSLGSLMPLMRSTATVLRFEDPRELNIALGRSAGGLTLYAGLMALGFLLGVRGA